MKAISLTEPMAWALFHGKDVENRTWKTNYRGKLLIHASLSFNYQHYRWIADNENRLLTNIPALNWVFINEKAHHYELPPEFVQGAIIGEVELVDCVRGHSSRWAFPDQWNWILANPVLYDKPIPMKGKLGLFEVQL